MILEWWLFWFTVSSKKAISYSEEREAAFWTGIVYSFEDEVNSVCIFIEGGKVGEKVVGERLDRDRENNKSFSFSHFLFNFDLPVLVSMQPHAHVYRSTLTWFS